MASPPITVGELIDVPAPLSAVNAAFMQEIAHRVVHRFASTAAMDASGLANGSFAFVAPTAYVRVGGVWLALATAASVTAVEAAAAANLAAVQAQLNGEAAQIDVIQAANWVTAARIADGNVTQSKIAQNAIDGWRLADGAVTASKITDGQVTNAKLAVAGVDYGAGYGFYRVGNMVTVWAMSVSNHSYTLLAGYRPARAFVMTVYVQGASPLSRGAIVQANGYLEASWGDAPANSISYSFTFPAA